MKRDRLTVIVHSPPIPYRRMRSQPMGRLVTLFGHLWEGHSDAFQASHTGSAKLSYALSVQGFHFPGEGANVSLPSANNGTTVLQCQGE